jgi:hypothetical protein
MCYSCNGPGASSVRLGNTAPPPPPGPIADAPQARRDWGNRSPRPGTTASCKPRKLPLGQGAPLPIGLPPRIIFLWGVRACSTWLGVPCWPDRGAPDGASAIGPGARTERHCHSEAAPPTASPSATRPSRWNGGNRVVALIHHPVREARAAAGLRLSASGNLRDLKRGMVKCDLPPGLGESAPLWVPTGSLPVLAIPARIS